MGPAKTSGSNRNTSGQVFPQANSSTASCVKIEGGQLLIDSGGGPVPDFLLRANQAVTAERLSEAAELLGPDKLKLLDTILDQDPSRTDLIYMLVKLLLALDRAAQAESWCKRLIELESTDVAWFHLALIYRRLPGRAPQARHWAQQAFEARPDSEPYADVYARSLIDCGQVSEAVGLLDNMTVHGWASGPLLRGILSMLLYSPQTTRADFRRGYGLLGQALGRGIVPRNRHDNDPDPSRRLRVGFISPDFRRNSTAIPFEVFLDGVNHEDLEIHAYGNVASADWVTERIQGKVDQYLSISGMSAGHVADLIAGHRVDILVALGGYVHNHCLEVLAHKPAPVQVDFGWVTTTGLPAIDYRITDALLDPPATQAYYTEKLVYLPGGSSVFVPPQASSLLGPLPADKNGHITYGSFNRRVKITDKMLGLWAMILEQTPGSRFIMKFPEGDLRLLQEALQGRFQDLGISPDRIDVYGPCSYHAYLDIMARVDIALDTFPFNGAITTFECLWMGIPVVTLTGEVFTSRMGLNILTRVGLSLFSATTAAEYVAKACAFSTQRESLAQIRRSLRQTMLSSPLCNPRALAGEMEVAFRQMWQQWCGHSHSQSPSTRESDCMSAR